MKKTFFTAALLFMTLAASAQYGYRDSNRIGISFGMNQFTLNTDNFKTKSGTGWNGGLSVRGNFYNDFDMVFGLQFSENNFSVETTGLSALSKKEVDFKLASAQMMLLLSYKIIENHLSVEFGPTVQANGKLTLDEADENLEISETLVANDIRPISQFQFYPTVGITAGVKHFRANVMYQYGVNNILGGLNDEGLGENFKGHAGILTGSLIIYF